MSLGSSEKLHLFGLELSQRDVVFPIHTGTKLLACELERLVKPGMKVLDVGTGTGALALVAAKKGATVVATDISIEACQLAYENAYNNWLLGNIQFSVGNLADSFEIADVELNGFDIVVFNLPSSPIPPTLESNPMLDGGGDGRKYLDAMLPEISRLLKTGGKVVTVQSNLSNIPKTLSFLKKNNFDYYYREELAEAGKHSVLLKQYFKENLPPHCQLYFNSVIGKYFYNLVVITAIKCPVAASAYLA